MSGRLVASAILNEVCVVLVTDAVCEQCLVSGSMICLIINFVAYAIKSRHVFFFPDMWFLLVEWNIILLVTEALCCQSTVIYLHICLFGCYL